MLRLSGLEPEYMYLRTRRELEKAVALFEKSRFRYLHISCHGNRHGIALTLDNLSFDELGEILAPALKGRRVFFSSCPSPMPARSVSVLGNWMPFRGRPVQEDRLRPGHDFLVGLLPPHAPRRGERDERPANTGDRIAPQGTSSASICATFLQSRQALALDSGRWIYEKHGKGSLLI